MRRIVLTALCFALLASAAEAKTYSIKAGANADADAQAAFAAATSGDAIRFGEGNFVITHPLTMTGDKIEVRGKSAEKTTLSFSGFAGDGLTVRGSGIYLRDFAVSGARGAGLAVSGVNINVEGVAAHGAGGSGILLNGVRGAIVQLSGADSAAAGIEVRNSTSVDLIGNAASGNDVGILIDNQPGAPSGGGIQVVKNKITGNRSVGVDIVAARDVAVLQNEIAEHGTANIFIRAFGGDAPDPQFNALSRNITVFKNEFGRAGFKPADEWAPATANGAVFADIVWDGARSYVAGGAPRTEPVLLAISDNASSAGAAPSFLNLGLEAAGAPASEADPSKTWPIVAHFDAPGPVKLK